MREHVLSLNPMAGDPVSLEYLKADLYHRAESLKDIPDTPLFFGRLDYAPDAVPAPQLSEGTTSEDGIAGHNFHIGRRHVHAPDGTPAVIDWRAGRRGAGPPPRPARPPDPGPGPPRRR